jgi:methionyl-tRNA synthetase
MQKKILITAALPYANGPLHFGHIAGAYLPADVYARFERLMQNDVLYISGSDEYGIAITLSAEMAKRTPQEHVDIFHEINKNFFKTLNISFDHYSRTTWEGHKPFVQQYFLDLLKNGYIEERITNQLYSEADHRFLADRYVIGTCPKCGFANARGDECPQCGANYEATDLINPRSKLSNAGLTLKPTKHWFLLLDKFKDQLLVWIAKKDWKPNVANFVKSYIEDLRPRAITRDMTWGVDIPLPDTEGKALYVWFDAPIGYISASAEWSIKENDPDRWKAYWCDQQTKLVHFIGKDNIPFHAVIFPAMTLGQDKPFKMVDELPANEFFNLEGRQFSKSDGWYIDLEDFFTNYSTDQIRYAIAANAPETSDSEFTWKDFQNRCNTDLVGKYGNLVNRVLVFARNHCGGKVPAIKDLHPIDEEFLSNIKKLVDEAAACYGSFKVRRASQTIMELSQLGNVYFDAKKPWKDAKDPDNKHAMETTIACCLECLKCLALISSPIIPETAGKVWKLLGYVSRLDQSSWAQVLAEPIPAHQLLQEPQILFKKVEDEQIDIETAKLAKLSQEARKVNPKEPMYTPLKEPVDIEDVRKLDLRVGVIKAAKALPKSKKLLLLEVDIGVETRSIVAGISQHYQPERLIGKKVVVVANLKPATLMGNMSQGMLLAGSLDDKLELITVDEILPGGTVS